MKEASARLLAFQRGSGTDDRGRRRHEILSRDDTWLEATHDFIQWLFPLREASAVTPEAPCIDGDVAAAFAREPALRDGLRESLDRMLAFYGLVRAESRIVASAQWPARSRNWFTGPTHNNLRITRILKSCVALGLAGDAVQLLEALDRLCADEPGCGVGASAQGYWRAAVATGVPRPGRE